MVEQVLQAAGLGVAGIDPVGAVLLVAAIGAGASKLKVYVFAASVFVRVPQPACPAAGGPAQLDPRDVATRSAAVRSRRVWSTRLVWVRVIPDTASICWSTA